MHLKNRQFDRRNLKFSEVKQFSLNITDIYGT